jgi:hypothetical protein
MSEDMPTVSVAVNNWPDPKHDDIEGSGFSISTTGADKQMILPQDPLRIRAFLTTDAVIYVGVKSGVLGDSGFATTNINHQAARLPISAYPYEIRSQNEVWIGTGGAANVGIWIERRVT